MNARFGLGALAVAAALLSAGGVRAGDDITAMTTFYVVRHAEKAASAGDPSLSEAGFRRAVELYDVLRNVPLSAVYATDTKRTKQTAAPAAEASRLDVTVYPPGPNESVGDWAERLVDNHRRKKKHVHVLIVGHSGPPEAPYTVPSIVQALSGQPVPAIGESEYDNLYAVTVVHRGPDDMERNVHRQWYGPLPAAGSAEIDPSGSAIHEGEDVSAAAKVGDFLVIGADEEASIQPLHIETVGSDENGGPRLKLAAGDPYPIRDSGELDIEGIAYAGHKLYVAGSHSWKREKVDPHDRKTLNRPLKDNRDRLRADAVIAADEEGNKRNHIYRVALDPVSGEEPEVEEDIELDDVFAEQAVLGPFAALPSKENGIDVEGIAAKDGKLYLGFRGPVLRFGNVPVMRLDFDHQDENELLYVNLAGRGIREIASVSDGFLIIAGPVGDSTLSYRLYHWDGKDCLPGKREADEPVQGRTTLLGTIPTPCGAKAEGLAVLDEDDAHYRVLVFYDGVAGGAPAVFRAHRP